MNREIKFRIYDKATKQIIYNPELEFVNLTGGGYIKRFLLPPDYFIVRAKEEEEFDIMQFTGCYDRNKKEIYEGDIFKCKSGNIYEVIFWSCGFWLSPINQCYEGYELQLLHDQNALGEVIGNKFENNELLEEGI